MPLHRENRIYDVFVRFGEGGVVQGAVVRYLEKVTDTETGEVLRARASEPRDINADELRETLGEAADYLGQIASLQAQVARLEQENEALSAP